MVPMGQDQRTEVREAFRNLFLADLAKNEVRDLPHYKNLFPGYWDVVAEEYDHLRAEAEPRGPHDGQTVVSHETSAVVARAPLRNATTSGDLIGHYRLVKELKVRTQSTDPASFFRGFGACRSWSPCRPPTYRFQASSREARNVQKARPGLHFAEDIEKTRRGRYSDNKLSISGVENEPEVLPDHPPDSLHVEWSPRPR